MIFADFVASSRLFSRPCKMQHLPYRAARILPD